MKNDFNSIGGYCREYRIVKMKKTLKEVEGSDQVKTLSSFEHGKSTNIKHLLKYVEKCESKEEKLKFLEGLLVHLEGEIDG